MSVSKLEAIHDHVTLNYRCMTVGVGGKLEKRRICVFQECF